MKKIILTTLVLILAIASVATKSTFAQGKSRTQDQIEFVGVIGGSCQFGQSPDFVDNKSLLLKRAALEAIHKCRQANHSSSECEIMGCYVEAQAWNNCYGVAYVRLRDPGQKSEPVTSCPDSHANDADF